MIISIHVDGFRSLSSFNLRLNPGLNILVGPNGSGKTNIISFFEFLSLLVVSPVGEAISKLGGAGTIFRKVNDNDFQNDITCTVYGVTPKFGAQGKSLYKYSFTIVLSEQKDLVYFAKQSFSYSSKVKVKDEEKIYNEDYKWDLEIVAEAKFDKDKSPQKADVILKNINLKRIKPAPYYPFLHVKKIGKRKKKRETPEDLLRKGLNEWFSGETHLHQSILKMTSEVFHLGPFAERDLRGGQAINIDPAKARLNQDSAAPPGMKRDGSGLTATLFALSKNSPINFTVASPRGYHYYALQHHYRAERGKLGGSQILKRIENLARLINPHIKKLDVKNSALDNLTQISVLMADGERFIELPFSSLSDGTVKWIALITAILTHESIFAIEEPENFLHPLVQKELLNIMRDETNTKRKMWGSSVILSTHSESLLNAAKATEIVVTSFEDGRTVARRPENPQAIAQEINRTGFGLGFYYVTGALNDG